MFNGDSGPRLCTSCPGLAGFWNLPVCTQRTVLWAVVQAHEENPASHRHEAGLGGTPRASDGAVRTPAYATSGRLGAGAAGGPEQGNDRVGL